MKTNKTLQLLALITSAGLLSACGASKNSSLSSQTDLASRTVVSTPVNTTNTASAKPLAYCNESTSVQQSMKVNIMSYIDNNNIRNDLMNVKIQIPANFENDQTYIQMWRWQVNSTGNANLDSVPVQIKVVSLDTGAEITGFKNFIRWSDVSKAASEIGASTGTSFFKHVRLVVDVRDPNAQFDVLKIVHYKTSDSSMVDQADILMPVFHANPADYAIEADGAARPQALLNLHPFITKMNQGWTSSDYSTWANNFCLPFQTVQ